MFESEESIKRILKNMIKDEIIQEIKAEVIKELKNSSEFNVKLKEFKMKKAFKKLNIWTVLKSFEIEKIQISTKYIYENGVKKTHDIDFEDILMLNKYCKTFNDTKFKDSDILGYTEIRCYIWYKYKSEKSEIISEPFTDSLSNDVYSVDAYIQIINTFKKFFKKHPELLI